MSPSKETYHEICLFFKYLGIRKKYTYSSDESVSERQSRGTTKTGSDVFKHRCRLLGKGESAGANGLVCCDPVLEL